MVIKTKIVPAKKGYFAKKFSSTPLGTEYVDIVYAKRSRLGKLLKVKSKRRINLPKGAKIQLIENNRPKVGQVFITYQI